jgi:hypothetical protein
VLGVVVPGGPVGVQLHVPLPLLARHLVVLGLRLPGQAVPLGGKAESQSDPETGNGYLDRRSCRASASSS